MASDRSVATSGGVLVSVGLANLVCGIVLALFINHYVRTFPILITTAWYDSYWLPVWVALVCYVVEAFWVKGHAGWLYGLLITGPPYGWHVGLATLVYLRDRSEVAVTEYLKVALPALLLALSGAALNPIVASLLARFRVKGQAGPTT